MKRFLAISSLSIALGCGSGVDQGAESRDAVLAQGTPAPDTQVHNPFACPAGEVFFNGKCRATRFFERFLSAGAELIGVAGPPATNSADSGVIVTEALSSGSFQELYLLPNKLEPGQPLFSGYDYRADYPVVYAESVTAWQDDEGFLNVFTQEYGPHFGSGFGPLSFGSLGWKHWLKTLSGWQAIYSDGSTGGAIASSSGSSSYCDAGAAAAGVAVTGVCLGTDLVASAITGAALGIVAGATVFAVGTSATIGLGTPEAFLGGIGAGTTVGAGAFGALAGVGAVACGALGTLTSVAVDATVCSGTPDPTVDDIQFVPLAPETPVPPSSDSKCPDGMVLYSGKVMKCETTNSVVNDPDAGEIEEVVVDCHVEYVSNACVYP